MSEGSGGRAARVVSLCRRAAPAFENVERAVGAGVPRAVPSGDIIAAVKIGDLLSSNDILLGIRADDIAHAAEQLFMQTLPRHGLSAKETRRLVDEVIAREREMPTTCGVSAIPHARDASLRAFIVAVGVNRDGILANEKEPRVIVAFLSPESKRQEHLDLLAALSRLSHDRATIDAIAAAQTAEDVVTLLQR